MSAASVQPRIPSFPATPAKKKTKNTKAEEAALLRRAGCAGACRAAPPLCPPARTVLPRLSPRLRGSNAVPEPGAGRGSCLEGFCSLPAPGKRHRPPPAPGILLPSPAQHRRSCSGIWEPHQSSARGRGCPWLPSRCRGCRAGLGSAAARLWAIPCALETGRESRDWEKSLQTPQQGEDPQRSPWKELPGCWRAAQPLLSLLPHGIPWGTIPAALLDGQHLQEIRLALTGCLVLQPLPLEALKNK